MCDCDEVPEFITQKIRKARKSHRCCECKNLISKGHMYAYNSGLWEGSFSSFKTCIFCHGLRSEAVEESGDNHCWPCFTGLLDYITDFGLTESENKWFAQHGRAAKI